MSNRTDQGMPLDRATSTSICKAIGERLQQNLGPEAPMPNSLQRLIDEMHRQEMLGNGHK